jgi:hypothetical protein
MKGLVGGSRGFSSAAFLCRSVVRNVFFHKSYCPPAKSSSAIVLSEFTGEDAYEL